MKFILYPYAHIYLCRSVRTEEPIWGEDEGFSDHDYYNSIPGKEPPIGGVVDSRLRGSGPLLGHIHSQPQGYTTTQVTLHTASSVFIIIVTRLVCMRAATPTVFKSMRGSAS